MTPTNYELRSSSRFPLPPFAQAVSVRLVCSYSFQLTTTFNRQLIQFKFDHCHRSLLSKTAPNPIPLYRVRRSFALIPRISPRQGAAWGRPICDCSGRPLGLPEHRISSPLGGEAAAEVAATRGEGAVAAGEDPEVAGADNALQQRRQPVDVGDLRVRLAVDLDEVQRREFISDRTFGIPELGVCRGKMRGDLADNTLGRL